MAYVLLLREGGFLLCLPKNFLSAEELAGEGGVSIGPPQLPCTSSGAVGGWGFAPSQRAGGRPHFGLAGGVLQAPCALGFRFFCGPAFRGARCQARQWVANEGGEAMSGYHTAEEANRSDVPGPGRRALKVKRPTVAQLASQQAFLEEVVTRLSSQLAQLVPQPHPQPSPRKVSLQKMPCRIQALSILPLLCGRRLCMPNSLRTRQFPNASLRPLARRPCAAHSLPWVLARTREPTCE